MGLTDVDHHEPYSVTKLLMKGTEASGRALGDRTGVGPEDQQRRGDLGEVSAVKATAIGRCHVEVRYSIVWSRVAPRVVHVVHDETGGEPVESVGLASARVEVLVRCRISISGPAQSWLNAEEVVLRTGDRYGCL
jgi:hypothetical protein